VWLRIDDMLNSNIKIRGLVDDNVTGERAITQRNETVGHWLALLVAAAQGTDGFLTADMVHSTGTKATTARLTRARFGRQPLMHELEPDGSAPACACLADRQWHDGFAYALHDFLDRNPSKNENDVQRAKKAELRNSKLKHAVRLRDRDQCRYCGVACDFADRRSDQGLTYDHVDPELAAGLENLVVACRGCNGRKGMRTPAQADMVLRPVPEPFQVLSLVGSESGSETVTDSVPEPVTEHGTGPSLDPTQEQAQVVGRMSPGRGGAGSVVDSHSTLVRDLHEPVDGQLAIQVGPPKPVRRTGQQASPYLKAEPNLRAGVPSSE
jgi:hypothetical protein